MHIETDRLLLVLQDDKIDREYVTQIGSLCFFGFERPCLDCMIRFKYGTSFNAHWEPMLLLL